MFELPRKSPGSMLSAALWQTGKGRRISLASTRRSCLRFAERSGDKPFDTSIFRGFEMAYLVRAQMHKRRQIPRKCLLNQGLKDESSLKLRRCRNKRRGTTQFGISQEHKWVNSR